MKSLSLAVVIVISCAGCASSIHVQRLDPKSTKVPTGVPWNLAMTQYTVTITRQVKSCAGFLNGTVSVSAVAGKRLDPDQQYVLSSNGVWATADITSSLAGDGTSTGLNAQSEDQTAKVISNTVGFLAAIATGTPAAAAAQMSCADDVSKALDNLNADATGVTLKKKVDKEMKDVAALTARVTQLTTLFQASQGKKADRAPLGEAMAALRKLQETMNEDQALLAASLKAIKDTQTVVWPPSAKAEENTTPFELDPGVAQSWIKWSGLAPGKDGKLMVPTVPADAFKVWLALYRTDGAGGWMLPTSDPMTGDVKVGVPVRLPRIGRLLACTEKACDPVLSRSWAADDKHTQLIEPDAPVLQFGQLYNVPLTGGTFKSEGAAISLDANGVPTSIQVTEKVAAAAAATGAAQSVATTVIDLPAKIAAAKLAKSQAALNQLKADNDLAAAKAATPTAGETAAANAQTAYLNASSALSTATANAQAAGERGALAVQTALTQQQVALQQQQAALGGAKASAAIAPAIETLNSSTTLLNAKATNINAQLALTKAEQAMNAP